MRILFAALLLCVCAAAQQPPALRTLPWNGHKAAVSLTFDDALPVHLDVAVPALRKRHLRATFFLIADKTIRMDEWKRAIRDGNEIGNHSASHENPNTLSAEAGFRQVEDAQEFFKANLGVRPLTYAYPYALTTKQARDAAMRYNFLARGWRVNGISQYLVPGCGLDWYNVPSIATHTITTPAEAEAWVDTARAKRAWVVLQIHGIGHAKFGFDPVPLDTFFTLLNKLAAAVNEGDVWVAPFGEVGAYWRASDIFERSATSPGVYQWDIPPNFPHGVVLLVKTKGAKLYQGEKEAKRDKRTNAYRVQFDAKELTVGR